jgi:adenine-specific DNA-methyltransferase
MTEKLDMTTPDMVSQNIERIASLFPHCVTETADGKAVDFDLLRQELSTDIVEGPKERYRLEWPGKREAIVTANMPTTNTLRPVREDSVNFDTTENLYIEGDNLEVLKLLQESYLGKIKMIDIDPPYNTGNDFVYRDNFAQDTDEFKADSGMTDDRGNRLVANPETSGRYHSDWLTMMYPRLKLARNLLTEDGLIFISIDDNEIHNLRKVCDEVFGEMNFIDCVIWKKRYGGGAKEKYLISLHEYVLVYAKNQNELADLFIPLTEESINRYYKLKDSNYSKRGPYRTHPLEATKSMGERKNLVFPIPAPDGTMVLPQRQWLWSKERVYEYLEKGEIEFIKSKNDSWSVHSKQYLNDENGEIRQGKPFSIIEDVYSQHGTNEVLDILGNAQIFSFPKPIKFLNYLLNVGASEKDSIVLDFFSGSATTAHAVMQLNAEDGGNRKFIMVQLPEKTDEKSEAYKAGYQNICEIGKERIRRAGAKIVETQGIASKKEKEKGASLFDSELKTQNSKLDIGFRVFRLDTSNMQDVYYRPQDYKQEMMDELFANHIKPERTADDLVAQVMLDWGLPLSLPIEQAKIAGKTVYKVDGNALYCCFDDNIDETFARAVSPFAPLRIVFHDHSFASDTAKENVRQLLKQLSSDTEMKVI